MGTLDGKSALVSGPGRGTGREIRVGMNPERAAMASTVIPFGRPGTAEEAAGAGYPLCTPDSDHINSQCIAVDAGRV